MTLGERIRKLRLKRGLSQAQLGVTCGWSMVGYCGKKKYDKAQIRISRYEKDIHEPSIDQLIELAKALKVSVKYLATGISNIQSKKD